MRFHISPVLRLIACAAVAAALWLSHGASPGFATLSGSTFESNDGNLVVNTAGNEDWANAPNLTKATDTPSGSTDSSFTMGAKEDDLSPGVGDGSVPPNKNDLKNFYTSNEFVGGNNFLYVAFTRAATSGSADIDFEINHLFTPSDATTGDPVTPLNRSAGDALFQFIFPGGGGPITALEIWRWAPDTTSVASGGFFTGVCLVKKAPPCWSDPSTPNSSQFEGDSNTVAVSNPLDPNCIGNCLATATFGEAAINLTGTGIFPSGTCSHFGAAWAKSRAADSGSSDLKDLIAPQAVNISNCGTVIIRKATVPSGTTDKFTFTPSSGLSSTTFQLADGGSKEYDNVPQGSYTVSENDPSTVGTLGYDLTKIDCSASTGTGTGGTGDVSTRTASITVQPGGIADCTFTNTERGHIIVKKVTDPSGSSQTFHFSASYNSTGFDLTDQQTNDSGGLLPGSSNTYSVTETGVTGWDLTSASCDNSSGTLSGSTLSGITVSAGGTTTCTFNNRARGTIDVLKVDDANSDATLASKLSGATFTLYNDNAPTGSFGAEDTSTGLTCTTGSNGHCTTQFTNIVPGNYCLAETTTPSGYDTASPQCFTLGSGGSVTETFVNPRKFKVIVLVCRDSDNSLYPSTVTVDGAQKTSLNTGGGGTISDSALCSLGGAAYDGKHFGDHPANVNIPQ
jgi:hypothetical protein